MVMLLVNRHQQLQNVDEIVQSKTETVYSLPKFRFFFFIRSHTPPSPRSPVSRSPSRSSVEEPKSPGVRKETNQRSPSPPRHSSSSSKRRRHKEGGDSGRHICEICNCDIDAAKRLYGVLDNCEHIL